MLVVSDALARLTTTVGSRSVARFTFPGELGNRARSYGAGVLPEVARFVSMGCSSGMARCRSLGVLTAGARSPNLGGSADVARYEVWLYSARGSLSGYGSLSIAGSLVTHG